MELTKYEHACFTVEKDGNIVVVDPGGFSTDYIPQENIAAIVITHAHGDHFDHDQITAIIDKNPEAIIIAPEAVTSEIEVFQTKSVAGGDSVSIAGFELEFFGDDHVSIYPTMPHTANVGVMINELLYYPGDSFTIPDKSVDTLALPVSAPWLKIQESIDFLKAINPRYAFPTHDAILSNIGRNMVDNMVAQFSDLSDTEYERIDGQSIEI